MKKIILTTLFIAVSISVFSQRIIVFDSNNDTVKKEMRNVEDKNAVYWNFAPILHGALVFDYERKINNYLHIMGGAGLTLVDLYSELVNLFKDNDIGFFGSNNTLGAGFLGEVALKIFPKQSDDMDGFYLGPLYRFKNYNSSFKFNDKKYKQTSNVHDIAFTFGWQGTTYNDFFYSVFLGLGYSFGFHNNYYRKDTDWIGSDYHKVITNIEPLPATRRNLLLPVFGITMGWVF